MKKLLIIAVAVFVAGFAIAEYRTVYWSSGSNTVANTITGKAGRTTTIVSVSQDVEGAVSNIATIVYAPATGGSFICPALTRVIGGSEVPQILNAGTTVTAPVTLKAGDTWTLTSATGDTSNTVYSILIRYDKD